MTAPERKQTLCCSAPAYLETLSLAEGTRRITFGRVPVCAKCYRIVGETKTDFNAPAFAREKFDGVAWRLMLDNHPRPPFTFKIADGRMVPEGWKEPEAQTDEEVPF